MASRLQVVLPADYLRGEDKRIPILILLAPEGEEGSRWLRHTQAETLSDKYQIAMVLVSCLQGCYTDMTFGYRFFQSLALGVPEYLHRIFPALHLENGRCYVAGASIGGMGAIKLALTQHKRFAAAASFSGRLDNRESFFNPVEGDWFTEKRMINLWGSPEAIPGSENDLQALAEKAVNNDSELPAFYISAGSDDAGFVSSRAFASDSRLQATFVERKGKQGWPGWANELEQFLAWCEKKGRFEKCR